MIVAEAGFGKQWFISVGFWVDALGGVRPDRVERTHLYFRLERLLPEHRYIILGAGMLDNAEQPQEYEQFLTLLAEAAEGRLRALGTEVGLRDAMKKGQLVHDGLVRHEARDWLQK